jgi:DNA-binding MarR family transcriptional regulator
MEARPPENESVDARIDRQAGQLRELLSRLMKIPREHALSDVELSPREFRLLIALGQEGEMTMTDLAAVLDAPLSTATRMVDRLEAKNLIERLRSEQDRRIVVVRNGARGQMFYDTVQRHHFELARRMLEPLSIGEREILLELMEKLTRGLSGSGPAKQA